MTYLLAGIAALMLVVYIMNERDKYYAMGETVAEISRGAYVWVDYGCTHVRSHDGEVNITYSGEWLYRMLKNNGLV